MAQQDTTYSELPIIDLIPLGASEETNKALNDLLRELGIEAPDSTRNAQPEINWQQIKTYAKYGGITVGSIWLISKIVK